MKITFEYKKLLLLCFLVLGTVYVLTGSPSPVVARGQGNAAQSTQENAEALAQRVPRYQVYEHLFSVLAALDRKADELKAKGEDDKRYREFYKRAAGLNEHQWKELQEIVADARKDIEDVDQEAQALIEKIRERNRQTNTFAPPSPKLEELQHKKNHIFASVPDKIKEKFGDDEFNRFDKFVRSGLSIDQNGVRNPGGRRFNR